jgi:hypothetical protein
MGFVASLGSILGALVVFVIGLIIASGIGEAVERLLGFAKIDKMLAKLGLKDVCERAGLNLNSGKFFGKLVYWFFIIVFLLAATDIVGFYTFSGFLRDILAYIPNILVAVIILIAALLIAHFLRRVVRAGMKGAGLGGEVMLGGIVWWGIMMFGLFAALDQLGIASMILNTLFIGIVAMLAIAGGIAFGLGGKDHANDLIRNIRNKVDRG